MVIERHLAIYGKIDVAYFVVDWRLEFTRVQRMTACGTPPLDASSSVAGLFNEVLQHTMNLVELCLDFRGVFQLCLEVLPYLNELVINDGEDFSTPNGRSRWSSRSPSFSRTSRPPWSTFSRLCPRHRVTCSSFAASATQ
jgi:hypothetical protein